MNVIIPKDEINTILKKPHYRKDHREKVYVHGALHYHCGHCRRIFRMWLEDGVEGENKKQPCPFVIRCPECGSNAQHVNWYSDIELDELQPLWKDAYFFALDKSKDEWACGIPSIYVGKCSE